MVVNQSLVTCETLIYNTDSHNSANNIRSSAWHVHCTHKNWTINTSHSQSILMVWHRAGWIYSWTYLVELEHSLDTESKEKIHIITFELWHLNMWILGFISKHCVTYVHVCHCHTLLFSYNINFKCWECGVNWSTTNPSELSLTLSMCLVEATGWCNPRTLLSGW